MIVYLDNSATTRPTDSVVQAVTECLTNGWHNPSALYKPSMEADKKKEAVREICLKAAGAAGQRLVFTSSGTEADNLAILGHMRTVKKPGKVLILGIEHPAVLQCSDELTRMGHEVLEIPVTKTASADLEKLEAMMDDTVCLICLMQVNNETGTIQPIREVCALRDRICPRAAIHVDGVQGFLRVPMDFNHSGIQSYAFSGHKIHAMKGIGGLIIKKGHKVSPIVFGGGQEDGYRSGTENMPGIISLGEAVRTYPADAPEKMRHMKQLLYDKIMEAVPGAILNGPALDDPQSSPHVLNMSLQPVRSQTMLFALEGDGIYVSAGSACSSRKQKVSGVLSAMGMSTLQADCSLRFSLCADITDEMIDYTAQRIKYHYDMLSRYVRK